MSFVRLPTVGISALLGTFCAALLLSLAWLTAGASEKPFPAGTAKASLSPPGLPEIARLDSQTGAAAEKVQHALALRIEVEEAQDEVAFGCARWLGAADEFVVLHAAVGQRDRAPGLDPYARSRCQSRSEHQRIEQIAFKTEQVRH